MTLRLSRLLSLLILASGSSLAAEPAQSGLSQKDLSCAQATSAALQGDLTSAGLIDGNKVDDKKTEVTLLAKESLPGGESRQVFLLTLHESTGRAVSVIAQSKTGIVPGTKPAEFECPADPPTAYVISKVL